MGFGEEKGLREGKKKRKRGQIVEDKEGGRGVLILVPVHLIRRAVWLRTARAGVELVRPPACSPSAKLYLPVTSRVLGFCDSAADKRYRRQTWENAGEDG